MPVKPQCMHWQTASRLYKVTLCDVLLVCSDNAADWVRISEMLLGPTPVNFSFAPKHKSNAYARSETEMAQDNNDQENG